MHGPGTPPRLAGGAPKKRCGTPEGGGGHPQFRCRVFATRTSDSAEVPHGGKQKNLGRFFGF